MKTGSESVRTCIVLLALVVSPWGRARASNPGDWTLPAPLTEVNSQFSDKAAFLSLDGLTLYFARDLGSSGCLYAAARQTAEGPFGEPWQIFELNPPDGAVDYPWVSPDNRRLYYYSSEGGWGRLKMSTKSTFTGWWRPGVELAELNGLGIVAYPSLTQDELVIVFSGLNLEGGLGQWDLWMASRSDRDSPFGQVTNLTAVNGASSEMHPRLTPDGRVLYFASNRNGVFQIFESARPSRDSRFGPPAHIALMDTLNGASLYPCLSADGSTFFFSREGEGEMMDIYASHRTYQNIHGVRLVRGGEAAGNFGGGAIFATIREAVAAANEGDLLALYPGIYRGPVSFMGKAITMESAGDAAILEAPGEFAVTFTGEGAASVLRNVIIRNSRIGIWLADSSPTITNITVAGNAMGIEAYGDSDPRISNSILWGNTESDLYGCQVTYSCVERGAGGEGNFSVDPLFAAPGSGDYHVRSEWGRYWPEKDMWVSDEVTSPCIDAGDPAADCFREPMPNGGRRNVGAHGGTAFAGMSPSPAR